MRRIQNLTLSHEDVKDYIIEQNKKVQNINPTIFAQSTNLVAESKYLYYGKIVSYAGVTAYRNGVPVALVQGNKEIECFFDAVLTTSNTFQFIGYQILINS